MKIYLFPSQEADECIQKTIDRGLGFSKQDFDAVEAYVEDVKKGEITP